MQQVKKELELLKEAVHTNQTAIKNIGRQVEDLKSNWHKERMDHWQYLKDMAETCLINIRNVKKMAKQGKIKVVNSK